MKITTNENKKLVQDIQTELKENNGYCPCSLAKTPDTKCMCKDFRDKLRNELWYGECHCGLYKKIKG